MKHVAPLSKINDPFHNASFCQIALRALEDLTHFGSIVLNEAGVTVQIFGKVDLGLVVLDVFPLCLFNCR